MAYSARSSARRLDVPLAPGDHKIGLKSPGAGGVLLLSENVVVVSVP